MLKDDFNDQDDFKPRSVILRPYRPDDWKKVCAIALSHIPQDTLSGKDAHAISESLETLAFDQPDSRLYTAVLRGGRIGGVMAHENIGKVNRFQFYPLATPVVHAPESGVTQTDIVAAMIESATVLSLATGTKKTSPVIYATTPKSVYLERNFMERNGVKMDDIYATALWGGITVFTLLSVPNVAALKKSLAARDYTP